MRSHFACVLFGFLLACSSTPEPAPLPKGDGSDLPMLYWKVELARKTVQSPITLNDAQFVRLFDDGRIVTYLDDSLGPNRVVVRDASGTWRDVLPPSSETGSLITWYEDEANMGGYFQNSPSHGWVLADGKLHTFDGPPGFPRGKLPDGSYLLDASINGYHYLQKWFFGPTDRDSLDIRDAFIQDQTKARHFARLSRSGTILMTPVANAENIHSPQAVFVDGKSVPIGPEEFNLAEPVDFAQEALFSCCRILTIDRIRGGILGIKNGRPVIKVGDMFDRVTDERAIPYGVNGKGDVVYASSDSKYYHSPRMRWGGTNYQFSLYEWSRLSRFDPNSNGSGIPEIVDVNEKGQVLFAVQSTQGTGWSLYLATPSLEPVPPPSLGTLRFTVKSGMVPTPAEMAFIDSSALSGSFSPTNLSLTAGLPSSVMGSARAITVNITNGTKTPFVVDAPISVVTGITPQGSYIASVSYTDLANSVNTLARGGTLRVKQQSPEGSFTVAFEGVELDDVSSAAAYTVTGEVTVLAP